MRPKHMTMLDQRAFDHAEETEAIHSYAQEWASLVYKSTYKLLNDALPMLQK